MEVTVEDIKFADVDITDPDILKTRPYKHRRSTLFVEFTDKNISDVDIQRAMQAGATGLKFKSGYTTRTEKTQFLKKVEKAKEWCQRAHNVEDWAVATCVTLKTCMIKTGLLENEEESIDVIEGSEVILTNHSHYIDRCNARRIFVDNPQLTIEMKRGMEVNLSQAEIILEVIDVHELGRSVKCKCTKGGKLKSMVSVSVRNMKHTRPYMTKKDLQILKFAVDYQIDIIVINYVRNVATIKKAKNFLNGYTGDRTTRPIILAGVCTQVGLENVNILIKAGKPYFVSGAVFLDGIETGNILNREISDVANAVLDGATGFIIKDCMDIDNTLTVIDAINRVCCYVEPMTGGQTAYWDMVKRLPLPVNAAEAAVMSAMLATDHTQSRVMILPTVTGRTVKAVLRMRPLCIVIAISTNVRIIRLLHTLRGVVGLLYTKPEPVARHKFYKAVQARIDHGLEYAVLKGWLKQGDTYVSMQRSTDSGCYCDMVRIWAAVITKKANIECPSEYDFGKKKDSKAKRKSQVSQDQEE